MPLQSSLAEVRILWMKSGADAVAVPNHAAMAGSRQAWLAPVFDGA